MRVVSLVPSATETLRALGVTPVACTRFCEQPDLATVGGTKDPNLAEIAALAPDLVVVNDEENRREDADALLAAGLVLHSMSPRSVAEVGPAVRDLAAAIDVPAPSPFAVAEWDGWQRETAHETGRGRVAVLIWRRPWMTMRDDTYGGSVLQILGWENVWPDSPDRYPEVALAALAEHRPDLVLLPSEPYPFAGRHVAEVQAGCPGARVDLIDGRDLFWWGIRTPAALRRIDRALARPQ